MRTISRLRKSEISSSKPASVTVQCTGRFVSDLVGNAEDRFSRGSNNIVCLAQECISLPTET